MEQGRLEVNILVFHVPQSHVEQRKQAIFTAGAGYMGNYEKCCWQVLGAGQFSPSTGAKSCIGTVGTLERLSEFCVVEALVASHPPEVPSCHIIPVLTLEQIVST